MNEIQLEYIRRFGMFPRLYGVDTESKEFIELLRQAIINNKPLEDEDIPEDFDEGIIEEKSENNEEEQANKLFNLGE